MYNHTDIKNLRNYISSLPIDLNHTIEEYEYDNPVLTLIDTVLSINRQYNSFVKPRIKLIKDSDINSFDKLSKELEKGDKHFMSLWNYKHAQRIELLRNLLLYFINYKNDNNIKDDLEALKKWGEESSVEKYKDWDIKGIGFTTYQYLRMLCGANTVKPDIHILRTVTNGVGRKLSLKDNVKIIEDISRKMDIKARDLDHAIWLYSSSKQYFGMPIP